MRRDNSAPHLPPWEELAARGIPPAPMSDDGPVLQLWLAGPARLQHGDRALTLERKAAGALAWLALRGPVRRERLADLLWPAAGPEGARNNLRQLIFKLKKAMEAAVIDGQDELRLPSSLRLEESTADTLLEGAAFDDCADFAAWLEQARAAHRLKVASARVAAADAAIEAGDLDRALALAQAAVAEDELSEAAHQRLVQALYLRGERAAALEAATRCETLLRGTLGVPLSDAMQRLVATVRSARTVTIAAPSIPASVLRPPRLIGRTDELSSLRQAFGERRVALLVGEPGLGKSRLLAEAAATLTGIRILSARPGDAAVPFATLARWLRTLQIAYPEAFAVLPPVLHRLLPEQVPSTPGHTAQELQAAVVDLFRRAHADGLCGAWLDDMHFADDASIEAAQGLIGEPDLAGMSWALARRAAEGSASLQRLADLLLDEGRLLPVTLRPLDEAHVAQLVDSLGVPGLSGSALAAELCRTTGGNPMYLLETIKAMVVQPGRAQGAAALPRPRSVGALIERRLHQLSAPALALARVAALAGPDFSTDLAVHVLQTPLMALADTWAELEAAQVLRDSAFAHDLIFEATLDSVPAAIRRHVRRAIAEFLSSRDAEPARLAEHWLAAGEPIKAAPQFLAAGKRAEAAARYAEARTLFERAAVCYDDASEKSKGFDTRLALADLLEEAAEFAAAQAVLDALRAGTSDERLRICLQQMNLFGNQGRHEEALALGESTLADDEVTAEAAPQRMAAVRCAMATYLNILSRHAEALAQLQLAEPVLAHTDDVQWRGEFHHVYAVSLAFVGDVANALRAEEQALAAAREGGRKRMIAGELQAAATFSVFAGRLVEALDQVDECLLLMADTGGEDRLSQFVRIQRGRLLAWLGRYGEALEALEPQVAAGSVRAAELRAVAQVALAEVWAHLGQPARARAVLQAAEADATSVLLRTLLAQASCEVAWLADEPHDAQLDAAAALSRDSLWQPRTKILQWRARPEEIDPAEMATLRSRWAEGGLAGHVAAADVLAAGAAWRRGELQDAAQAVARSLPTLRQVLLAGLYRPWLALELARAALTADAALARRALSSAVDWIHSVARFQVPEPLRDSFLRHNRINREVLELAASLRDDLR